MKKAQVRQSIKWHKYGALLAALGIAQLCGCALVNPYPKPVNPKSGKVHDAIAKVNEVCRISTRNPLTQADGKSTDPDAVALCESYEYAERWRQTYVSAARQHSIARNSAALITIPLAGVAVFEGLRETGNSDRIARLSTEAIGVYSLTNFLTSSPRQKTYLSGAKALTCTMFEARPWLVGLSFGTELNSGIRNVSESSNALTNAIAESGLPPNDPNIENAFRVLSDGRNSLARGIRISGDLRAAGMTLRNRVDFITDTVSELVRATEPSPESLASLFGNYAGATGVFQQGIKSAKGKGGGTGEQQAGQLTDRDERKQAAIDKVLGAVTRLRAHTEALNSVIVMVGDATNTVDSIKGCRPEGADSGFEVNPAGESITVEVGKTFEFQVKNNVAQPVRTLVGSNVDAVKLETITVKDGGFVIGVTGVKATDEDGPTLVITDGTGSRSKSIKIIVTGGDGGGDQAGGQQAGVVGARSGPPIKAQPADPATRQLDATETASLTQAGVSVRKLQCYLGVSQDGKFGKATRAAVAAKRTSAPDETGKKDTVDQALILELKAAVQTPAHAACKDL